MINEKKEDYSVKQNNPRISTLYFLKNLFKVILIIP